mgnify:CR=1
MQQLESIWRAILRAFTKVGAFPQLIANAADQRRRQAIRNELETERLDRIRNPSKYRGK